MMTMCTQFRIEKILLGICLLTTAGLAQISDNGLQYVVQPSGVVSVQGGDHAGENLIGSPVVVQRRDDASGYSAMLLQYDLRELKSTDSVHSAIYGTETASGPGSSPAFAVYAVENNWDPQTVTFNSMPKKICRIGEVVTRESATRTLIFPVNTYLRNHFGDEKVSFLIEMRSAPGFSQAAEFSGKPELKIAKLPQPRYDLQTLLAPVWAGSRIENETLLPTSVGGKPAEGNLALIPSKILSVKNYGLYEEYQEGRDFVMDGRTLRLTENSSIQSRTYEELYHQDPKGFPGVQTAKDGGFIAFSEGTFLEARQLAVTYLHDEPWDGPVPVPAEKNLPRTFEKLRTGAPLKLVVYGDSISQGGSASGHAVRAPWLPRWADLVADQLRRSSGCDIDYINTSLGGTRSDWGRESVDGLVSFEKPDLVILGFGMNDGTAPVPFTVEEFCDNIRFMMQAIRKQNPDTEFMLLMSWQPNEKWRGFGPMPDYLTAFKEMEGPGVAVADVWSIHDYLLKHKTYWDMSINHVNHPNDFIVRIYAQTILARLGVEVK
jgi:hypothetical protein